jgi:hypothetical protein
MSILDRRVEKLEALSINKQKVVIVQLPWQTEEEAIQEWMLKNNIFVRPNKIDCMIQIKEG